MTRQKLFFWVISVLSVSLCFADAADGVSQSPWKIVNFWSESCRPCRVEIPELNELSEELNPSKVVVVGVNFDEDSRQATLEIAERMGIAFPTLTIAEVKSLHIKPPFVLPTTYILAPDNTVKAKLVGAQNSAALKFKLTELGL